MREFNIILAVTGAVALIFAWLYSISIQAELIPTIVNGMIIATSTAIIFTGIFFTLGCTNKLLELQRKSAHPKVILAFLGLASFFVLLTFFLLLTNNFMIALKVSFTGLILASGTFMSLIALLIQELNQQTCGSDARF